MSSGPSTFFRDPIWAMTHRLGNIDLQDGDLPRAIQDKSGAHFISFMNDCHHHNNNTEISPVRVSYDKNRF